MAAANMLTLTDANFDAEVLKSTMPVLVDFWAEWCGPCKMLGPVIDELASEYEGRIKMGKLNIDDHQRVASDYGIRAIPTLLLFKDGKVVEQMVGMKNRRELKSTLDRFAA